MPTNAPALLPPLTREQLDRVVPKVPRNLFFTGTVNVDESISPKVLDRAFTLELNEVNLDGLSNLDGFADEEPKWIVKELNKILAEENRHFGYRVAAEKVA